MRIGKALAIGVMGLVVQGVAAMEPFTLIRVSTPLIVSGSAGLRLGTDDGTALRPSVQVEAGIGGGRVAVGLDKAGSAHFVGYAIKGAILQTWLESIDVDEDQTFLGLETELSIQRLLLSVGGYRRVSDGDDDWLVSAGIGFLF